MASKLSADAVPADTAKIVDVWTQNPELPLWSIKPTDLQANITRVQTLSASVQSKRTELTGLMDQRDDETRSLNETVTRAKSGLRAFYGPDSPQYAQAGGTRRSERKSPYPEAEAQTVSQSP